MLGAAWTPEEAARSQVELLRGLAADPKAKRLYLRRVQIVETMRDSRGAVVYEHAAPERRLQRRSSTKILTP